MKNVTTNKLVNDKEFLFFIYMLEPKHNQLRQDRIQDFYITSSQ